MRAPVSETNLRQLNSIAADEAIQRRGPMKVTVCGLWIVSPTIELPQPVLNVHRITFPGSPDDRIGRKYESMAIGMTDGPKGVASIAKNASCCGIM